MIKNNTKHPTKFEQQKQRQKRRQQLAVSGYNPFFLFVYFLNFRSFVKESEKRDFHFMPSSQGIFSAEVLWGVHVLGVQHSLSAKIIWA